MLLLRLFRMVHPMTLSRLFFPAAWAVFASLFVSCNGPEPESVVPQGEAEVCIGIPETRTVLDADGLSTRWEKGDRFALWAFAGGSATFAAVPFDFWGNKAEHTGAALFRGKVPAMPSDTYTYYAASPVPAATEGTRVSYDLPAVQDGTWHGDYDVLLAQASGRELRVPAAGAIDDVNPLDLRFRHKIHALKVTIPEGRNRFGRPVTRLRVQFPVAVAGRLTWDLAAPDAAPAVEQASDAVTLEFARPVGAGDSFWIYVAPCDLTGREVRFTATDGAEFSWPIETGAFRNLEAGQITSVTLTIPDLRPAHDFRVTLDSSHLGETVTEAQFVGPDDYVFATLSASNESEVCVPDGSGAFTLRLFDDQGAFPTASEIVVGSKSAENVRGRLGSAQCAVSNLTSTGCSIMAPYLFYEDFSSSINNNSHEEDDSGSELVVAGLPGWTGSRWKVDQQSLEFRTHISTAVGPNGKYGRVDSPVLPVRSGCSVKVSLHYEIGAAFSGGASTFQSKILPVCIFGLSSDLGAPSGGSNSNQNYPSTRIEEYTLGKDGSPTYQPTAKDNEISDVSDGMRLTWFGYFSRSGAAAVTNAKFYYYLDNIRVTIAQ